MSIYIDLGASLERLMRDRRHSLSVEMANDEN